MRYYKSIISRKSSLSTIGLVLALFFTTIALKAQNNVTTHNEKKHKHSLAIIISHTQINEGRDESGNKQWLSLPSWGVNYNYSLSKKWLVGIHTDIVVEDFAVESPTRSSEVIERSYPIASALVGSYKLNSFNFMLGSGVEIAKEEILFLLRAGVEYNVHINSNYELLANITNDLKFNAYNSWAIGLGIARMF